MSTPPPTATPALPPDDPSTPTAAADLASTTSPPPHATDAPPSHALTSNRAFLASIPPDSLSLQQVHSASLPSIPNAASAAIGAAYSTALNALLSNVSDDAACTLLYAIPRLLLFMPPPEQARAHLPATLNDRARRLRLGHGPALWLAYDWTSNRAVDTSIHTIHPARLPSIINNHLARDSPARAFHRIYSIPFAPPVPSVAPLLLSKVPTAHNPDLDLTATIPIAAADLLPPIDPSSPRSARIFDAEARQATILRWSKAIRAHPLGAPDGTGTRTCYLLASPDVLPLLSLLLDGMRRGLISPAHRRLLTTKTTSGQCKKLDDGTYPTSVDAITAVRPLCRHNVIRRHLARMTARSVTRHRRSFLESHGQYGNSPSGCDIAVHRMQLYAELFPPLIHHLLDIVNAHTSVSRRAVHTALHDAIHDPHAATPDLDALTYFLLMYSVPGPTLVQSGQTFIPYLQTDGLDQGCGIAGYSFNLAYSIAIHHAISSLPSPITLPPPRPHPRRHHPRPPRLPPLLREPLLPHRHRRHQIPSPPPPQP